jgi:hypothetical protein
MHERLEDQKITIRELRRLFFGSKSEKLSKVLDKLEEETSTSEVPSDSNRKGPEEAAGGNDVPSSEENSSPGEEGESPEQDEEASEKDRKGHGRNSASAYEGAEKVTVAHQSLKPLGIPVL